jgi:hypothetical protein
MKSPLRAVMSGRGGGGRGGRAARRWKWAIALFPAGTIGTRKARSGGRARLVFEDDIDEVQRRLVVQEVPPAAVAVRRRRRQPADRAVVVAAGAERDLEHGRVGEAAAVAGAEGLEEEEALRDVEPHLLVHPLAPAHVQLPQLGASLHHLRGRTAAHPHRSLASKHSPGIGWRM